MSFSRPIRSRLVMASMVAVAVLVSLASPRVIPYNMDEFVHYHALGCGQFPLSAEYNTSSDYRETCTQYGLRLPGTRTFLPLRSYIYIGSFPVLAFYPFWRILADPVAVRVQGAVFFLAAAWLTARLVGVRASAALLASLLFPFYSLLFLVDTGPVGISILLLLVTLLLARAAVQTTSRPRALGLAALAGLTTFLGIFVKLLFTWNLPGIAIFALSEGRESGPLASIVKRKAPALLAYLLGLGLPLGLLLLSRDVEGNPYYAVTGEHGRFTLELDRNWNIATRLGRHLFSSAAVVPRTLTIGSSPADLLPPALLVGLFAWCAWRGRRDAGRLGVYALMAATTFGSMSLSRSAWLPHHFVFALVPLVWGVALALTRLAETSMPVLLAVALVAAVPWTSLAMRLPAAAVNPEANSAKDRLLAFVRSEGLDRRTLQVHTTWGTYHLAHLFGSREQAVLFIKKFTERPEMMDEVRAVAEKEKRGVLVISSREPEFVATREAERVLGPPVARYEFENWRAFEYLR